MEPLAVQTTTGLREQARLKPSQRGAKGKLDFCVIHQGFAPDCIPGEVHTWGYKKPKPKKYPVCGKCREQELNVVPPPAKAATTGISLVGNGFCWERVLFLTEKSLKKQLTIRIPQLVGILGHKVIASHGERGSSNPRARKGLSGVPAIVGAGILKPGTVGVSKDRLDLDSIGEGRDILSQVEKALEMGIRSGLVNRRAELTKQKHARWVGFEFNFRVDLRTMVSYFEQWDELKTRRELGLNVNLRGGMDRILIGDDWVSELVDFKTFNPGANKWRFRHTRQMSWYGTVHRWHRRDHTSRDEPLSPDLILMEHRFIGKDGTGTQPTTFQEEDPRAVLAEIYEFWHYFSRAHAARLTMDPDDWQKKFFKPTPGSYCKNCPAFGKCSATKEKRSEDQVPISEIREGVIGDEELRLIT